MDNNYKKDLTLINPRLEVRDYSLAERVEVVNHDEKEQIYWEINFIFRDVQNSEGNDVPIYCKEKNMFEDLYHIARSFEYAFESFESHYVPCGRPMTLSLPSIKRLMLFFAHNF